MLIHPWDAAQSDDEWKAWLRPRDFGTLVAAGRDRSVPVVVPTHFVHDGDATVLLHLARPNPVWRAIDENPHVVLSVVDDIAYIPSAWKTVGEDVPGHGIPTSYYAAVVLTCTAEVLTGEVLLEVLRTQLAHFEPGSGVADPSVHTRKLPGIRGMRLSVDAVAAKFKYGGNVDDAHRARVAAELAARDRPGDAASRAHLLRRTPLT
ncbi:FMN-binding negative transcriptional regulator [Nocardioides sp.]|uniref:FMN-binding negative transcriptional regulator n=1 Tax=Nocardioides sp. TaxID=35761 RepID=UPI0026222C4B|nr:FMN-binding negative transcriptional regulator [Nocardioides sp.]MCW2735620.1 transcriptional regulator protein [Nocardioides sp.]